MQRDGQNPPGQLEWPRSSREKLTGAPELCRMSRAQSYRAVEEASVDRLGLSPEARCHQVRPEPLLRACLAGAAPCLRALVTRRLEPETNSFDQATDLVLFEAFPRVLPTAAQSWVWRF